MHSIYYFADINECETGNLSITATPMLSVTTLKALAFVHANQDITETALTAQVK